MNQPAENIETPSRIAECLARLDKEKKPALITYTMAGDPNPKNSLAVMNSLVSAGSDIIELGMPFSDPMADGPTIQRAAIRALKNGINVTKTLEQLYKFRQENDYTPVVLMGYYNPILKYGIEEFCHDAKLAGADGLIIVDLPPEEDAALHKSTQIKELDLIKLAAPTSDDKRMDIITQHASGFVYFISMTGTTGTKTVNPSTVMPHIKTLRKHTKLPIAVGFGIKTPEQAQEIGKFADAVVIGSAIVDVIEKNTITGTGTALDQKLSADVYEFVEKISQALKEVDKLY